MSTVIYVPRTFGGLLIITVTPPPTSTVPNLEVMALFRSGGACASYRDGAQEAPYRDGTLEATQRDGTAEGTYRDGTIYPGGR